MHGGGGGGWGLEEGGCTSGTGSALAEERSPKGRALGCPNAMSKRLSGLRASGLVRNMFGSQPMREQTQLVHGQTCIGQIA